MNQITGTKTQKRTITVLVRDPEYLAISKAAAAARMSRGAWLLAAADEKLARDVQRSKGRAA